MTPPKTPLNRDQLRFTVALLIQAAYNTLDCGETQENQDELLSFMQDVTQQLGWGLSVLVMFVTGKAISVSEAIGNEEIDLDYLVRAFAVERQKMQKPEMPDIDNLADQWCNVFFKSIA